jgi:CelD/BcsL family acetyltransferase involved in cellulose biosynthesis
MTQETTLQVQIYTGRAGLAAIGEEWHRLYGAVRHRRFFHHHGWWKSYLSVLEPEPESVSFFVVRRAGQAVAILPLKHEVQRWHGLPVRQWGLPRHPHLPLNDILLDREADCAEVLAVLLKRLRAHAAPRWDALRFADVLEESTLAGYAKGRGGRVVIEQSKTCDYLICDGSYEQITAKFSRNFRSNLNKARNKLAREKEVAFRAVTDPSMLTAAFYQFLDVEASGWKGAHGTGTAIKLHPELMKFYQALIEEFGASGEVVINSLSVGGRPIAVQFCVRDEETLYVLKLAYDEDWARVAPGNMLLERVIEKGIQDKEFRYVNLVNDPPWFKDWRPAGQGIYNIWLFNATPWGMALLAAMRAKQRLKPYYRHYLARDRAAGHPVRVPRAG